MPTYEYRCKDCGQPLELFQSFTDDPLTECPRCGGRLRKVFGSVGISFKGSGFYKTDSRSTTKAGANGKKEKKEATEPTGSKESSSGSKDSSSGSKETSTSSSTSSGSTAKSA